MLRERPPCDACGGDVAPGRAVLSANLHEATEVARQLNQLHKDWWGQEPKVTAAGEALDSYPKLVPWLWGHPDCVGGEFSYVIAEERIDTAAKALGWTLRLMEKPWFRGTAWHYAMRRLGLVVEA